LHINTCLQAKEHSEQTRREIEHAIQNILAYHKTDTSTLIKRAIGIVYADEACCTKAQTSWPEWVVDTSSDSTVYHAGWPICSVIAEAKSIAQAKNEIIQKKQLVIGLVSRLTNQ